MPGFNPEKINIHDLTVEEPEKEAGLPFDPEKDITEKDWGEMQYQLGEYRFDGDYIKFSEQAMAMKVLNPSVNLGLNETDRGNLKNILEGFRNNKPNWGEYRWSNFAQRAAEMKIIDPEIDLRLDNTAWDGMVARLGEHKASKEWSAFCIMAMNMKLLDPKIELDLEDEDWNSIKKSLGKWKGANFVLIFSSAMAAKILDPAIDFNLDDTIWDAFKNKLDDYRNNKPGLGGDRSWHSFPMQAMAMKILAAEEVKVTNEGLEVNMRKAKTLEPEAPEMPEQRSF